MLRVMSASLSSRPTSGSFGTPTPGSGLLGHVVLLFHYFEETPYRFSYISYDGLYAQGLFPRPQEHLFLRFHATSVLVEI